MMNGTPAPVEQILHPSTQNTELGSHKSSKPVIWSNFYSYSGASYLVAITEDTPQCIVCQDGENIAQIELKCSTKACKHRLCIPCFTRLPSGDACPMCRTEIKFISEARGRLTIDKELKNAMAKCTCTWEGTALGISRHEFDCEQIFSCLNPGCVMMYRPHCLHLHKLDCSFQKVYCTSCGDSVVHRNMYAHRLLCQPNETVLVPMQVSLRRQTHTALRIFVRYLHRLENGDSHLTGREFSALFRERQETIRDLEQRFGIEPIQAHELPPSQGESNILLEVQESDSSSGEELETEAGTDDSSDEEHANPGPAPARPALTCNCSIQ